MKKFIDEDVVRQVKQTADIEKTVSAFLTLKKVGQGYTCKCPFCGNNGFTVTPRLNMFKCFGCGKSGNSITFLMEKEGKTYPEAIEWLAAKNNITLIYKDNG